MRALCLALYLASGPVAAAQFYSLQVSHDDGVYRMVADIHLAAPPEQVYKVLTDYAHLSRISPSVVKSSLVQRLDAATALVYTDTRVCIFIYCRHARELQRIVQLSPEDLSAEVVPKPENNIKSGSALLHVEAERGGTRLHWELAIEPGFWVPPLIGPVLLSGSLRAEGERSAAGIEKLAREEAQLPPLTGGAEDEKNPSGGTL
ncbi:MAG: SRPBCC family protein [Bacillota bacterium]